APGQTGAATATGGRRRADRDAAGEGVIMRGGDGECRGELVARAQRGPLSAADRSALRAHLVSCDSCRLIQQVASDFAEMSAVDRSDDSRLERMSALA